jgi:hypothetical protein
MTDEIPISGEERTEGGEGEVNIAVKRGRGVRLLGYLYTQTKTQTNNHV